MGEKVETGIKHATPEIIEMVRAERDLILDDEGICATSDILDTALEHIEQQQARIAELLKERDTQIGIGVTDAEEMDQLAQRAEAAESALAQAETREAELVEELSVLNAEFTALAIEEIGIGEVLARQAQRKRYATPDRIKAAAEVLRVPEPIIEATEQALDGNLLGERAQPRVRTWLDAVRRLGQPESG